MATVCPDVLLIDLAMPEVTENYDSRVNMQIDYRDFGAEIPPIKPPVPNGEGGFVGPTVENTASYGGPGHVCIAGHGC